MSGFVLEQQQGFATQHQEEHRTGIRPRFAAHFCQTCYPPPTENRLTTEFKNFGLGYLTSVAP